MNWYKKSQKRIEQPYYRVVCPVMYGSGFGLKGDRVGTDTYWTPRWDAILFMLRSIFLAYNSNRTEREARNPDWNTKIYKIEEAIMQDAPKEHGWAFTYRTDAGEQILVKALSTPEVVFEAHPSEPEFESVLEESFQYDNPINYAFDESLKVLHNDGEVFLYPNYKTKTIEVAKRNEDGWSFVVVKEIRSLDELDKFLRESQFNKETFDERGALSWFTSDMDWIEEDTSQIVRNAMRRTNRGSIEGYFDCPDCRSSLDLEDLDSDTFGSGRHWCQTCWKAVLPIELRKVPINERTNYCIDKSGLTKEEIQKRKGFL